jgi:hypothetical protein
MFGEHGSVDLGKLSDARQFITMLARHTTDQQEDFAHPSSLISWFTIAFSGHSYLYNHHHVDNVTSPVVITSA